MRKSIAIFSVLATAMLAAPNADAAEALRKFGFGVSMDGGVGIEVPINLTPTFRVAPLVSFSMNSTTVERASGDAAESGGQAIGLGVGAYSLMRTEGPYLMYVGGRVGALLSSTSQKHASLAVEAGSVGPSQKQGDAENGTSGTDIAVAGVLGSEYFFNPRFSLGAEVSLNIILVGDREQDKDDDDVTETSTNVTTGGAVNARFYF